MHRFPLTARIAVVLGYLLGTWMFVDGVHCLVTGDYLRFHGELGPWANLVGRLGVAPRQLAWVIVAYGVLWLTMGNVFLFQRTRAAWTCLLALCLATGWYLGFATPLLLAELVLLLLPMTRHALRRAG